MKKVLLVEDDPGIARFLQRGLAIEGYQVEWVANGVDALQAARKSPAVAILDLGLPDMDGLSVCRAWRRGLPELPVLILSARDAVESKVAGLDAGADDYLTKPFAFEELLARVRALFRRGSNPAAALPDACLTVGCLMLDRTTRQVQCHGSDIPLTEREFVLLEFLMRHAGKVISRERILETAWGAREDISINAVDVYVGYLRRKLEETCGDRWIHTVRGVGFKLVVPPPATAHYQSSGQPLQPSM